MKTKYPVKHNQIQRSISTLRKDIFHQLRKRPKILNYLYDQYVIKTKSLTNACDSFTQTGSAPSVNQKCFTKAAIYHNGQKCLLGCRGLQMNVASIKSSDVIEGHHS